MFDSFEIELINSDITQSNCAADNRTIRGREAFAAAGPYQVPRARPHQRRRAGADCAVGVARIVCALHTPCAVVVCNCTPNRRSSCSSTKRAWCRTAPRCWYVLSQLAHPHFHHFAAVVQQRKGRRRVFVHRVHIAANVRLTPPIGRAYSGIITWYRIKIARHDM